MNLSYSLVVIAVFIGIGLLARNYEIKRDTSNELIAGVCAGIAKTFKINPLWVRLGFVFSGIGLFFYIILAIIMEEE
jgi:phage shock protein PspC (stress-responsive transcriptional regulator)